MLLKRYGMVFRDVLARETNLPTWRELLIAFRVWKIAEKSAEAVLWMVSWRTVCPAGSRRIRARDAGAQPVRETITISAADPLNLVGIFVPGERVPAISARRSAFRNGVAAPLASETAAHDVAAAGSSLKSSKN